VTDSLGAMFEQGWSLDGPFDAAVKWETKQTSGAWGLSYNIWYIGAHVKLRRVVG
jgi:hypothetical protein